MQDDQAIAGLLASVPRQYQTQITDASLFK